MWTSIVAIHSDTSWWVRIARPLVAVLVGVALSAPASRANPPLSSRRLSWGLEVSGGWSSYGLSAVNDSLRSLNQDAGTAFGAIRSGSDFGAALRAWASSRVLLRLSLEKHSAVESDDGMRYDIGPWNATIGATYFFPTQRRLRVGAGLAAGLIWVRGRFEGPQFDLDSRGSGPDLRAIGEAMWPLRQGWFVSGSAGVRYARAFDVTLDGQSTDTPADFSGFILRVAVGHDGPPAETP